MTQVIILNSMNGYKAPVRPLGAHALASHIAQKYTVKVVDFCSDLRTNDLITIIEKYRDSSTLCIGISTTFWQDSYKDHEIDGGEPKWVIDLRAQYSVDLPWVLGGPNTGGPFQCEWEKTFGGYSEDEFMVYLNSLSGDTCPHHIFDIKTDQTKYHAIGIQPYEALGLETARGCSFKCKFCAFPLVGKRKGTYIRNADSIREELVRNHGEFGTTKYYIVDDTFNETQEKIDEFTGMLQTLPFPVEWTCFLRLDLVARFPGSLDKMVDTGLKSAFFGIESFHPFAALTVGKGWNGKGAQEELLRIQQQFGKRFNWMMGLIAGLPGEPPESWEKTQKWCMDNNMPSWYWQPLNFKPEQLYRSEFDLNAEKYGYELFKLPSGHTRWNADWTNSSEAEAYCKRFNDEALDRQRLSHCYLFDAGNVAGSNLDELMQTPLRRLFEDPRLTRKSSFLRKYTESALESKVVI